MPSLEVNNPYFIPCHGRFCFFGEKKKKKKKVFLLKESQIILKFLHKLTYVRKFRKRINFSPTLQHWQCVTSLTGFAGGGWQCCSSAKGSSPPLPRFTASGGPEPGQSRVSGCPLLPQHCRKRGPHIRSPPAMLQLVPQNSLKIL